jgi:hypothetical protein
MEYSPIADGDRHNCPRETYAVIQQRKEYVSIHGLRRVKGRWLRGLLLGVSLELLLCGSVALAQAIVIEVTPTGACVDRLGDYQNPVTIGLVSGEVVEVYEVQLVPQPWWILLLASGLSGLEGYATFRRRTRVWATKHNLVSATVVLSQDGPLLFERQLCNRLSTGQCGVGAAGMVDAADLKSVLG